MLKWSGEHAQKQHERAELLDAVEAHLETDPWQKLLLYNRHHTGYGMMLAPGIAEMHTRAINCAIDNPLYREELATRLRRDGAVLYLAGEPAHLPKILNLLSEPVGRSDGVVLAVVKLLVHFGADAGVVLSEKQKAQLYDVGRIHVDCDEEPETEY